jgi:hypothetical protein
VGTWSWRDNLGSPMDAALDCRAFPRRFCASSRGLCNSSRSDRMDKQDSWRPYGIIVSLTAVRKALSETQTTPTRRLQVCIAIGGASLRIALGSSLVKRPRGRQMATSTHFGRRWCHVRAFHV